MTNAAGRSSERYARKREAILDAATIELNRRGVRGLTLSLAGEAVGLSTTSVTYYFRRKDDLAAACLQRGIDWLDSLVESALQEKEPADRLRRLLDIYFENARLTELREAAPLPVFGDIRALGPSHRSEVLEAYMRVFRKLRTLFDAPALEHLTLGRRTARTHLLLQQVLGSPTWLKVRPLERIGEVRDAMADLMIHGLAGEAQAWDPPRLPIAELGEGEPPERDEFLLATSRLVNARGYHGASVDMISAELNVTKGSFYHHNAAKDDLVGAAGAHSFEVSSRVLRAAEQAPGPAWSRLQAATAALIEYQVSDFGPLLRSTAIWAMPPELSGPMTEQLGKVADGFAHLLEQGAKDGSIRPVAPDLAAQIICAGVGAAGELNSWVPGIRQAAAPAIFARPLLMGLFCR